MAHVIEINDIEELEPYRLVWDSLLPNTPKASFFHTLDWLKVYWSHFGQDQKLRVLIVYSGGSPIGIVPLCVRTQRHRIGSLRVLTYPLDDWGMWYGAIGPNQAATMLMAMRHLRNTARDWDMIDLRWTGPCKSDGGRSGRAMRVAGFATEKQEYQTTSLIDLSGSWEEYLADKPSKVRHEIRRVSRRVFDDQNAQTIHHRPAPEREGDGEPRWDLFAMCQQVASTSWQGKSTSGNTLTHERVRDFLQDEHALASKLGMVEINLLMVDDRPAAFGYNYHYQGNVYGLRMGYDPTSECKGLGMALMTRSLEGSFERGDRCLDLGPGDWDFKRRLRTSTETSFRLTHNPITSLRSQAVRLSRWVKRMSQPELGNKSQKV